jgi:hypothetical protein
MVRLTCTKEVTDKIAKKVRLGSSIKRAGPECGHPWNTVKEWLRKGREALELADAKDEEVSEQARPFAEFLVAMEKAKATWAGRAERKIAAADDWKAHAYLLERRYGKEYRLPPLARLEPNAGDPAGSVGDQVPNHSDEGTTITVLVYPVPVPIGADLRKLQLPTGHVLEHVDVEGKGDK